MTIYIIKQRLTFYDGDTTDWSTVYAAKSREDAENDVEMLKDNRPVDNGLSEIEFEIEETELY